MRKAIIVRNDRLGDTILALPAINLLHHLIPNVEVHFLAHPTLRELLGCVEGIHHVWSADDRGVPDLTGALHEQNFDAAYCLRPTLQNARLLRRAKIPRRIGTSRRLYSYLFTDRVNLPRRGAHRHECELNLALVSDSLKLSCFQPTMPAFRLLDDLHRSAGRLLEENGLTLHQGYVVLHPGSGGSAREWPVQYFRDLADRIADLTDQRVVVTGLPQDALKASFVASGRHICLAGRTDLLTLTAVVKRATVVVGNSSGPLHLAAALGTKIVGLYPPIADCLPERWGAFGQMEACLVPGVPLCRRCRPGAVSPCRCMEHLTVESVLAKVMEQLTLD